MAYTRYCFIVGSVDVVYSLSPMDSPMVRPSRMSERRWNEGPDGLHHTMLDVAELACFRLERFQKRHKLHVPARKPEWSSELHRESPGLSSDTVVVAERFMHHLPHDVVEEALWPVLMNGSCSHDNFKTLCLMRCVCKAWMEFSERSKEWPSALESWKKGVHRYMSDYDVNPYLDTDSESDPDWGYADSDEE